MNWTRPAGICENDGGRSETIRSDTSGLSCSSFESAFSIPYRNLKPELKPNHPTIKLELGPQLGIGRNRFASTGVGRTLTHGFQAENRSARNRFPQMT